MFFRVPVPLLEYLCINDVCIWIDTYDRFINSYGNWQSERKEEIVFPDVKVISCSFGSENELKRIVIPEGVEELDKFTLPDNFEIEARITNNDDAVIYVKKNSKAHKALKVFLNDYENLWNVKYK